MPYVQMNSEVMKDRLCLGETLFEPSLDSFPPILPNFGREVWLEVS